LIDWRFIGAEDDDCQLFIKMISGVISVNCPVSENNSSILDSKRDESPMSQYPEFTGIEEQAESALNAYGAFFFPQLVTIDDQNVKLGDLQSRPWQSHSRDVVIEHLVPNGDKVLVSDDGLVVVFKQNKLDALSFLNTIFATALTFSIQGEFLQERDVCHIQYYPKSRYLWINSYQIPSERMTFSLLRDNPSSGQHEDWRQYPRRLLKPDEFRRIADRAYEYTTKPELHDDLILAFESFTLLIREAFNGAFLFGWMIVETFLAKLWKEYVESQKRTSDDKQALRDFRSWTGYHHIEMFAAVGKVNPTVRNLLNRLRKKRNDIVHNRDTVTRDEASGCLRVATVILLNRLKNPDTPFLNLEQTPLVDLWRCRQDVEE
jgi:hypothetical protein